MKKILAMILALTLCLTLCACSCASQTSDKPDKVACSEIVIRTLVEQNLDCYFLFYVSPIEHTTQRNSDGYYGTDGSLFATYDELKNLVTSTYVEKKATELLNYPKKETPLYKEVSGKIFTKHDVAEYNKYDIIWDTYTVTINESTENQCKFKLETVTLDSEPYTTEGTAVYSNGKWLLSDIIY